MIVTEGLEISMSNYAPNESRVKRELREGKLAYINKVTLPSDASVSAQGDQFTKNAGDLSIGKDSNKSAESQISDGDFGRFSFAGRRNKHDNETIKDNSFIPEEAKPNWYRLTETSTDEGEQINEIPNPNRWLEASTSFLPKYCNFHII